MTLRQLALNRCRFEGIDASNNRLDEAIDTFYNPNRFDRKISKEEKYRRVTEKKDKEFFQYLESFCNLL